MQTPSGDTTPTSARAFATTMWNVVLTAREDSQQAHDALEQLCRVYWYPLYAYVRRRGHAPHDAEDLTQDFFAHLLAKKGLASVDPDKGRFRSFLLASLKNFLANEWDKTQTLKRGGGQVFVPLDAVLAEKRYGCEPVDDLSPDKLFDRSWALTVMERVVCRLREECNRDGKKDLFAQLKGTLTGEKAMAYAEAAQKLGATEGAIKVAAHRLRQRYGELIREEIAGTVRSPELADAELRELFQAIS